MKKLFLILFLLICTKAFADPSLAQVLSWKYGDVANTCQADTKDMSANPKMVICGWKSSEKQPDDQRIAQITQDYVNSIDYEASNFDEKKFKESLYVAFSQDINKLIKLEPYYPLLMDLTQFRNFSAIKQLIQALQKATILEDADAAMIAQVFLDNGIDLSKVDNV